MLTLNIFSDYFTNTNFATILENFKIYLINLLFHNNSPKNNLKTVNLKTEWSPLITLCNIGIEVLGIENKCVESGSRIKIVLELTHL